MNSDELFFLTSKNMRIEDKEQSDLMYRLVDMHPHKAMHYNWDDIGTATLIADLYQDKIRYCPNYKAWFLWDGSRWKRQVDENFMSDNLQTVLNLLNYYCDEIEDDNIDDYRKYIKSIRKYVAMKNILKVLETQVRIYPEEMDTDPYLLNTPMVMYDLKTGKTKPVDPQMNITMVTNCNMKGVHKTCKRWYSFIDEIMSHNKEKAAFLQRALGYSLLGVNKSECMFIAYGSKTRNGKGTLFYAIENALGKDYYGSSSPELICELGNGRKPDFNAPQPGVASLVGKRFCVMSEADRDHRLDSATVKFYTGRDTVRTRGLYESPFEFVPQFTMWLETNFLPAVTDDTIFRSERIWVIPFNEQFTGDSQDSNLKDLFTEPENKPTILKWLYEGCMDYMKNGLQVPDCIKEATEDYRKRHDRIGMFLEKRCKTEKGAKTSRGEVYAAYRKWCNETENRFKPVGSTTFYQELEMRGYYVHRSSSDRYYEDFALV